MLVSACLVGGERRPAHTVIAELTDTQWNGATAQLPSADDIELDL